MAKGATLSELVSDLRDELRRVNSPSASPDDTASLRRTINHVIRVIYYSNDWPFLNTMFDRITLNAGQRFYDFPAGLDPDRVIDARVWWSGTAEEVEKGISLDDYNAYDPNQDERTSPILKWDERFTGTKNQLEVWPLPDGTDQTLQFYGTYAVDKLTNDTDVCPLESEIVVLYAAAELLPNDSADKEAKLAVAKEMLRLTKVRGNSAGGRVFTNGAGSSATKPHPRAVVRVRG